MPDLPPLDSPRFELVTVARIYSQSLAQLARARFEAEGLHAIILDEQIGTIYPCHLVAIGGMRLQVPVSELPAANALLDQLRHELQSDTEPLDEEILTQLALEMDNESVEDDALAAEASMAAADALNVPRCPRCSRTDLAEEPAPIASDKLPRLLGGLITGLDWGPSSPLTRFTCRSCGHAWQSDA